MVYSGNILEFIVHSLNSKTNTDKNDKFYKMLEKEHKKSLFSNLQKEKNNKIFFFLVLFLYILKIPSLFDIMITKIYPFPILGALLNIFWYISKKNNYPKFIKKLIKKINFFYFFIFQIFLIIYIIICYKSSTESLTSVLFEKFSYEKNTKFQSFGNLKLINYNQSSITDFQVYFSNFNFYQTENKLNYSNLFNSDFYINENKTNSIFNNINNTNFSILNFFNIESLGKINNIMKENDKVNIDYYIPIGYIINLMEIKSNLIVEIFSLIFFCVISIIFYLKKSIKWVFLFVFTYLFLFIFFALYNGNNYIFPYSEYDRGNSTIIRYDYNENYKINNFLNIFNNFSEIFNKENNSQEKKAQNFTFISQNISGDFQKNFNFSSSFSNMEFLNNYFKQIKNDNFFENFLSKIKTTNIFNFYLLISIIFTYIIYLDEINKNFFLKNIFFENFLLKKYYNNGNEFFYDKTILQFSLSTKINNFGENFSYSQKIKKNSFELKNSYELEGQNIKNIVNTNLAKENSDFTCEYNLKNIEIILNNSFKNFLKDKSDENKSKPLTSKNVVLSKLNKIDELNSSIIEDPKDNSMPQIENKISEERNLLSNKNSNFSEYTNLKNFLKKIFMDYLCFANLRSRDFYDFYLKNLEFLKIIKNEKHQKNTKENYWNKNKQLNFDFLENHHRKKFSIKNDLLKSSEDNIKIGDLTFNENLKNKFFNFTENLFLDKLDINFLNIFPEIYDKNIFLELFYYEENKFYFLNNFNFHQINSEENSLNFKNLNNFIKKHIQAIEILEKNNSFPNDEKNFENLILKNKTISSIDMNIKFPPNPKENFLRKFDYLIFFIKFFIKYRLEIYENCEENKAKSPVSQIKTKPRSNPRMENKNTITLKNKTKSSDKNNNLKKQIRNSQIKHTNFFFEKKNLKDNNNPSFPIETNNYYLGPFKNNFNINTKDLILNSANINLMNPNNLINNISNTIINVNNNNNSNQNNILNTNQNLEGINLNFNNSNEFFKSEFVKNHFISPEEENFNEILKEKKNQISYFLSNEKNEKFKKNFMNFIFSSEYINLGSFTFDQTPNTNYTNDEICEEMKKKINEENNFLNNSINIVKEELISTNFKKTIYNPDEKYSKKKLSASQIPSNKSNKDLLENKSTVEKNSTKEKFQIKLRYLNELETLDFIFIKQQPEIILKPICLDKVSDLKGFSNEYLNNSTNNNNNSYNPNVKNPSNNLSRFGSILQNKKSSSIIRNRRNSSVKRFFFLKKNSDEKENDIQLLNTNNNPNENNQNQNESISNANIYNNNNNSKQKSFAKIAHEFKTPINSIIGLINKVKDNLNEEKIFFSENSTKTNQDGVTQFFQGIVPKIKKSKKFNTNRMPSERDFELYNKTDVKTYINTTLDPLNPTPINEKMHSINNDLNLILNLSNYTIYLINDVIQYSTNSDNEISNLKVNLEFIDLKDILEFCFNIAKTLINCNQTKSNAIKVLFEYDEKIENLLIKSDEIRLKQILLNLISNSVKFTKRGAIKIKATICEETNTISVIISDTGLGISEEDKSKLFQENVMLNNGYNMNRMGSGLGLSICKAIAKMLEIKIMLESEINKGSKFILNIPFKFPKKNNSNKMKTSSIVLNTTSINDVEKFSKILKKKSMSLLNSEPKIKKKSFKDLDPDVLSVGKDDPNKTLILEEDAINYLLNDCKKGNFEKEVYIKFLINERRNKNHKLSNTDFFVKHDFEKKNNSNYLSDNSNNMLAIAKNSSDDLSSNIRSKSLKIEDNELNSINIKPLNSNRNLLSASLIKKEINSVDIGSDGNNNTSIESPSKILIVDDNQFIRESFKKICRDLMNEFGNKFIILEGNDGIDIINKVIENQTDGKLKCIFTDENMEYINGTDAIRIVRVLEAEHKISSNIIISVTSLEDESSKEYILESGANYIIAKPYSKNQILTALIKYDVINIKGKKFNVE